MNFLNHLFNTDKKQEIDNSAKVIFHAMIEWKRLLPEMAMRDARANNLTIDDFFSLLAINGDADKYIDSVHRELFKDLITETIVKDAIIDVKTVIINRLNITDEETKSYVHDVIFRRIILLGDFNISLPPLEDHYGNRINEKQAAQIYEMTQLILGLPGLAEKYNS